MSSKNDMPLCCFGPGGDFKKEYVPEEEATAHNDASTLRGLFETFSAALAEKLMWPVCVHIDGKSSFASNSKSKHQSLNHKFDIGGYQGESYTNKTRNPANVQGISREKTLFPDDEGISKTAGKKSNNRVRTLQRSSPKRISIGIQGQGTLFETYPAS